MRNFSVNVNDVEYWISRSIAAVTYVYTIINGEFCVLANKRGSGLPTNVGKWNSPSGYLDFNESIAECAAREIWEETGVRIPSGVLKLRTIDDRPTRRGMQNVLFRYTAFIPNGDKLELTNKHSEPNEVDEIAWIPMSELNNYVWVSDKHKKSIVDYAKFYRENLLFWRLRHLWHKS